MSAIGGKADMPFAEIRLQGLFGVSGHRFLRRICPRMTQSGQPAVDCATQLDQVDTHRS